VAKDDRTKFARITVIDAEDWLTQAHCSFK
jgi:hypothetical protein